MPEREKEWGAKAEPSIRQGQWAEMAVKRATSQETRMSKGPEMGWNSA